MLNFLQKPLVLSIIMVVTFTWFSYLWWQDQKNRTMADFIHQARTAQVLPNANTLPTPPGHPEGAAAAVQAVQ